MLSISSAGSWPLRWRSRCASTTSHAHSRCPHPRQAVARAHSEPLGIDNLRGTYDAALMAACLARSNVTRLRSQTAGRSRSASARCARRGCAASWSSRDLLPLFVFVAARIASLHPDKLPEHRPVTVEQRVFLIRRRWHAPAKSLTAGHCVRIPAACRVAARRLRRLDLLLCMSLGQRGQREERHRQHAHFALLHNRAVVGLGDKAGTSAPRRHTVKAAAYSSQKCARRADFPYLALGHAYPLACRAGG